MDRIELKKVRRTRRQLRIRKRVRGSATKPRLTVTRSLQHIYAQLIDDDTGVTVCQASTMDRQLRTAVNAGGNKVAATTIGKALAERARAKGIESICFDRNGYRFHGRVKALADAAREGGLKF